MYILITSFQNDKKNGSMDETGRIDILFIRVSIVFLRSYVVHRWNVVVLYSQ